MTASFARPVNLGNQMKIAITGGDGRIGCVLKRHWQPTHEIVAIGNEHNLLETGSWQHRLADVDTIVHLAATLDRHEMLETFEANLTMLLNVVRAAPGCRRFVFASSLWTMHEQLAVGPRGNFYSASKLAGEAVLTAWSDVHRKPAVSLRIGKFGELDTLEHEMLRVDEAAIRFWFDKAIAYREPSHAVWLAIGRTDHLAETPPGP